MKRSEMLKLLADAIEYHDWKGEPDFEIVDALHEACYRWDV